MKLPNWLTPKGDNFEQVKETAVDIKGMWVQTLSPNEAIRNARQETFQEAKARLGLTEIDLIQNYRSNAFIFYISLFFTATCFFGATYYLFVKHNLLSALAMLSIMLLCLANSFKYSFRAFQIKHRKLCSVKEWWIRENEWFPKIKK
ncbi:hypothetical protein [Ralstonia mannitolilytica]|uniref:hypothetical protein n=1 Tax=Ralstonia mannitolilytica TaxID=105219 RepID=UPI001C96AAE6|nr:hypothetical protein [Ralstonia mannitolilytica]MBY4717569.1 hypothetical protein [Ralstonia mannitolilytica]